MDENQTPLSRRDDAAVKQSTAQVSTPQLRMIDVLLRHSPDLILVNDRQGRFLYANPTAAQAMGLAQEAIQDKTAAQLGYPPDVREQFRPCRDRVLTTGQSCSTEIVLPTPVGSRDFAFTFSPIINEAGEIWATLFVGRDVTERREAERRLAWRERDFATLAENSPDVIARLDRDLRYLYVNASVSREMERILQYSPSEFVGKTRAEAGFTPEIAAEADALCREAMVTGEERQFIFAQPVPGGVVHGEMRIVPEFDADGQVQTVLCITRDITAQKQVADALRDSEQRLRTALQAGNMGIWQRDLRTMEVQWSEETYRLLHIDPTTFPGTYAAFEQIVHPDDREALRLASRTAIANQTIYESEYRIVLPDGEIRWIRDTGGITAEVDGQPLRLQGTITDITDRKLLEEQYFQAQKMESLGRFAGGISHDFNNLLSVVLGYAELMEMELSGDSNLLASVRNIQSAAGRAAALTRQLLTFTRHQATSPMVVDVHDLIISLVPMLRPLLGETIKLDVETYVEDAWVRADAAQLEQVLVNLAVNARDAMPGGGSLSITTANMTVMEGANVTNAQLDPGHYVVISVADTGIGMTPAVQAKLFEPFFTTKPPGKGTGLGLATCYGIVKQNQGHIRVTSAVGKGATFTIYLPGVKEAVTTASGEEIRVDWRGTETLLVVEDEPLVRELTVNRLQRYGYHVLAAADGVEALFIAQEYQGTIHLLLSDLIMPYLGGFELSQRLMLARPELRTLFVSGYAPDRLKSESTRTMGIPLLQKPFSTDTLLMKVQEVLKGSGARKESEEASPG